MRLPEAAKTASTSSRRTDPTPPRPTARLECTTREDDAVIFLCETCGTEMRDLRGVFLAHRAGGWRIECASHEDADYQMDGGRMFGGGLHALELFADLARARWFEPAPLFEAFLRLKAQTRGIYALRPAAKGAGRPR